MHDCQDFDWKQNLLAGVFFASKMFRLSDLTTGGSWKKSPQRISWMPPNGLSLRRISFATFSMS